MRVRAPILLALAVFALLGCEEATTEAFEISGFVTEFTAGGGANATPISGARVSFTSDTLRSAETTTNDSGVYRLVVEVDVVPIGGLTFGEVRAEAEGFRPDTETVVFDTRRRRVDLRLQGRPE